MQMSSDDCKDALYQTSINLEALINFVIAQGDDLSRQDVAAMLILVLDAIPKYPTRE